MTRSAVDYEDLIDTSFSDANQTVRSSLRPRWERKKQQQQTMSSSGGEPSASTAPNGDRFIPNRAGMNMEISKHLLRSSSFSKDAENEVPADMKAVAASKKDSYNTTLSSTLLGVEDLNENRVISYQEKAPVPKGDTVNNLNILYSASSSSNAKKGSTKLVSRHIPTAPSRILDAPDLKDDFYLNLVSWNEKNVLAVALDKTVYLWNAGTGDIQELCTFDESPDSYISSVKWVQEGGTHLAVGVSSGMTQLWDANECKRVRNMDGHTARVGTLAWNRHNLSSGSVDSTIVNHDVRVARHNIATLKGHSQEVCSLAWSPNGDTLASGGNDNLVCLWDAAETGRTQPRFKLTEHQATVKALAWSPHERHLLATGGGTSDRTIKFWNTRTGSVLNSIDTGSQVCALQWNPFEKEILSSHGFPRNHLCLWKYPSMAPIKEFEGHTHRVLHLALSPEGGTVLSAAADETLRFWDIFAPPAAKKHGNGDPFASGEVAGRRESRWTSQLR